MALETADLVEIQMLVARYGHILDERDWDNLDQVFAAEIVFDGSDFGIGVIRGIPAIAETWREPFDGHPLGHHTTNVVVEEDADGTVRVRSKHIGPRPGSITMLTYLDVVVRTERGWRLSERVARLEHRIPMHEAP